MSPCRDVAILHWRIKYKTAVLSFQVVHSGVPLPSHQAAWLHSELTFSDWLFRSCSLTYKVLTTAQPGYLRNLISVDSPHIETRSSSSVTLSRPSSSSSLRITDRSFRYASPCLWNKLPASFRQLNPDHFFSLFSTELSKLICPIITTVIVHHPYSFPL